MATPIPPLGAEAAGAATAPPLPSAVFEAVVLGLPGHSILSVVDTLPLLPIAYVLLSTIPLALLGYVRRYRDRPGYDGMALLMTGSVTWCLALAAMHLSSGGPVGFAMANVRILSAYVGTLGWVLVGLEFTGVLAVTPRRLAVLLVPGLIVQGFGWTDPDGLMWADSGFYSVSAWDPGPVYVVHVAMAYGMILLGAALYATAAYRSKGVRRDQNLALLASIVPPLVASLAFQTFDAVTVDITPLGLIGSMPIVAWALFRADLLETVPIARSRAIEELPDPVVVLDTNRRVIDANPAIEALVEESGALGEPIEEYFTQFPSLADLFRDGAVDGAQVELADGNRLRYFDLSETTVEDGSGTALGRVVTFREVTDRERREQRLRERERELNLLRQVFERTLRHNIRNEVTVLSGYAEQIQAVGGGEVGDLAAEIANTSDDLADASEKARTVGRLVDRSSEPMLVDVRESVDSAVDAVEEAFPEVEFTVSGAQSVQAFVDPTVEIGLRNLIENAAEHNHGSRRHVDTTIEQFEDEAVVTIADDGPGIPDEELAVLRRGEVTPLEHGSGLGMWIVYWVEETTDATVEFETGSEGTTVTVRLPLLNADRSVDHSNRQ